MPGESPGPATDPSLRPGVKNASRARARSQRRVRAARNAPRRGHSRRERSATNGRCADVDGVLHMADLAFVLVMLAGFGVCALALRALQGR